MMVRSVAYFKKFKLLYLLTSLIIVLGDQALKLFIINHYQLGEVNSIIPGIISFNYLQNSGAAWNILPGQMLIFYLISLIAIIVCLYYLLIKNVDALSFNWGLALILGGIIGNFIDRLHLKYVIDMIQLDFINFNIFNLADSAITCGVILVVIYLLFFSNDERE